METIEINEVSGDRPIMATEGDRAVRVEFGRRIDQAVNHRVHRFCRAVDAASIPGVVECIPAYAVATVIYDPAVVAADELLRTLAHMESVASSSGETPMAGFLASLRPKGRSHSRTDSTSSAVAAAAMVPIEIPVLYGGHYGPDLADVARAHDLSEDAAVALHTGVDYHCYMLGFMPGFAYLGETPPDLRTPRLATPRVRVPAGSVGIADAQTAVYPQDTPGGWNIIGRTPLHLFDWDADPPALIQPGDVVRFRAIDEAEFEALS